MHRILLSVVLLGASLGALADTLYWKGGSGNWNNADNWQGAAVPQAGDSVVFTNEASLITVENDIEGLSLATLTIRTNETTGAAAPIVFTGKKLTFTSSGTAWWANGAYTNAMPLVFAHNEYAAKGTTNPSVNSGCDGVFLGDIELQGDFNAGVRGFREGFTTRFYGTITGESSIFYGTGNHSVRFYGRVAVRGFIIQSWVNNQFYFHAAGNSWQTNDFGYGCCLHAVVAGAFPTNMVMTWTERRKDGGNESGGYISYAEQTIDRIETAQVKDRTKTGAYPQRFNVGYPENYFWGTATLKLRATASACCSAAIWPHQSIDYDPTDDFTQTFRDREHRTDGTLAVRGGTIESYGTNTFKYVTGLTVYPAGTFKLSKDENGDVCDPFGTVTVGEIRYGGKIDVVSGGTVTFKSLTANGVVVAPGTYQGTDGTDAAAERVSWIRGGGLVSVLTAEDVTCWKSPVSGSWADADNWTAGIPTTGKKTYVTADGANYTVTVPGGTAMPTALTIRNDVGCATVDAVGDLEVQSWTWALARGGEFRVSGGTVVFTNGISSGSFVISGEESQTGRLTVASGTFKFAPTTGGQRLNLKTGGLIDLRGGLFDLPTLKANANTILIQNGGILRASGGEFSTMSGNRWGWMTFAEDGTEFSGTSVLKAYFESQWNVKPTAAGETARLAFSGQARLGSSVSFIHVGGLAGGRAVVDFASEAAHGGTSWSEGLFYGYNLWVGYNAGVGEVNISAGYLPIYATGIAIGTADNNGKNTTGVKGVLRMSGGSIYNRASDNFHGWYQGGIVGTIVGYGANTNVREGWPYEGELYLSGGSITNHYGPTLVGLGYAKGKIVISGGEYRTQYADPNFPTALGMGGGIGSLTITGGSFVSRRSDTSIYVGGCSTNLFGNRYSDLTVSGYPIDRHDAVGTLSFSGGTLDVEGGVVLGADGQGTFERIGSSGTVTIANDFVFSNAVENAASGGTLVFRLDETGKVGTIAVGGKLKLDAKAKIVVDTGSGETESLHCTLLAAKGGIAGSLAEDAVSFTGARAGGAKLRLVGGALRLVRSAGCALVIR